MFNFKIICTTNSRLSFLALLIVAVVIMFTTHMHPDMISSNLRHTSVPIIKDSHDIVNTPIPFTSIETNKFISYVYTTTNVSPITHGPTERPKRIRVDGIPTPSKQIQACIHPVLNESDPIMLKFYRKVPKTVCPILDWVYVENGTLQFIEQVYENYSSVSCNYSPLIRKDENSYVFGEPIVNISIPFPIIHDAFKISCNGSDSNNGTSYENILQGVSFNQDYVDRKQDPMKEGFEGMSIAIFGFDSMSQMSWHRRLPITRKYMLEEMGAIELKQHNIVGDGTTAVMFPMLTGKFEWELPECRVKFKGAKHMDDFPWIWNDFKKAGYLTSWSNARPDSAPFNWRMMGFKNKPTDFYPRPFYLSIFPALKKSRKLCWGSQSRHDMWLKWFDDIFLMYKQQRKFLFHFITDMSHGDNNLLTEMDEPVQEMLQHMYEDGYLNNTLLILMGDHGARYGKVRRTLQGKIEERLPYFSFVFPKWFEQNYPDAIKNLKINTKRLTTPFDIHETFKQFFNYTGTGMGDISNRGISLFKEIPLARTCQHAGIASHWCACLGWKETNISDPNTKKAIQATLDTINGYMRTYTSDCAILAIDNVITATKMEIGTDLLKFVSTDEDGGIYKIKMNSKQKSDRTLYQLTFSTTPGGGIFEVTITHDLIKDIYLLSEKEISRINKYGNAPHCILSKNRQIRAYCYCRDLIPS